MPSVPMFPPLDCSLLFNDLIDFQMSHNPTLPMLAYADDRASEHPVTEISFLEFGRAAHRVAHVLRPGRAGDDEGQVVMVIANCDTILFHAVVAGLTMAGWVPFLVSHRNPAAAVVDMMIKTDCSRIMTMHHAHGGLIESIREELGGRKLVVDELPTMSHAFPRLGREVETDPFVPYPALKSRRDLDGPAIYFHSSGSTGFPKPIPHTHRIQITWLGNAMIQSFKRLPLSSRIGAMGLPPFHGYGTVIQMYLPITCLVTAVVYAPRAVTDPRIAPVIPTSDNMLDHVRWTRCKVLVTVPTFLEQWALSRENVEELSKLESVLYGGGPLAENVGDDLCAAGVAVGTCYGGTEFGCPTQIRLKADIRDGDWIWMHFSEAVNIRWVPHGDDRYECQILASDNHPLAFENLPDVKGYATSDLFIKHPTKNLWKIVGRADDVITLASGEKTVPAPMEGLISSSPLVQGAVMFGRERNQVGVIVEPRPEHAVDSGDATAVAKFRHEIWPFVEEANKTAPAFSRIFKEMILIATPDKPILRTPKGSIQKKATIEAYGADIDALYNSVQVASSSSGVAGPLAWSTACLEGWLSEHANATSRDRPIDPRADLFTQGFDSLSATYMRNQIVNALRVSPDPGVRHAVSDIPINIVFQNPTLQLLAARIASIVAASGTLEDVDPRQQHVTAMNAMIDRYSNGLPRSVLQNGARDRAVVLLTGSTGGLGSFLLARLIESPTVERVYAFNRPSSTSSADRQRSAFVDKGLSIDLLESDKLVFVEADASRDGCGLSPALYDEIRGTVTVIVHSAWRLDFNLSLASFEPNIKATRNLVDLALDSHHGRSLRFVFTSSVGSAQSWDSARGPFPEEVLYDPSSAVGNGYGEAKYVCERIVVGSGLRATSLRIGQIAGGPNGAWATTDWVPIVVKSSIALGAFPDSQGVVSWMRAEEVAASVLDVALAEDAPPALNIVNPQRPAWSALMSSIRDAVSKLASPTEERLTTVPFADWVVLLEQRAETATTDDLASVPALKLLEFFRGIGRRESTQARTEIGEACGVAEFSTAKAQRASETVARMRAVGEAEARAWVGYWSSVGLI